VTSRNIEAHKQPHCLSVTPELIRGTSPTLVLLGTVTDIVCGRSVKQHAISFVPVTRQPNSVFSLL